MSRALSRALWVALAATGCGGPASPSPALPTAPPPTTSAAPSAEPRAEPGTGAAAAPATTDPVLAEDLRRTFVEVSQARQLSVRAPVAGRRLDRDEVLRLIVAKAEREVPRSIMEAQGELLRAFGLTPPDYPFVDGIYELIQKNVAGFYDEEAKTLFLLDDLPTLGDRETLAHELEHALQDQHYDLDGLLRYRPGDSDRVTAGHALCEGDAMSTMFDVTVGSAFQLDADQLRIAMVASVALSESGAATPRVLQAALVAPYVDGFRMVQALRSRGGWAAVDRAFLRLPASTEQLLHLDKYDENEQAIAVSTPLPPSGDGWKTEDADVLGEQGLRMIFEQWSRTARAAEAAAGWGGDRYLVASRSRGQSRELAVAWHMVFDSSADADEAEAVLVRQQPEDCRERGDLGPLAYLRRGAALVLVAGPFRRDGEGRLASASDCAAAKSWAKRVLGAP